MANWQEELEEAKDLFECGIISESDFEELKAEVLRKRDTLVSYGIIEATPDAGGSDLIEMVRIPAGTFMMGVLPNGEDPYGWAKPRHEVEITKDFYVGKYQVTQKLWKEVMGNNPSKFKGENLPVTKITWFDAVAFCNKLSELEGKEPVYTINGTNVTCDWEAKGYRLLTESEWEYCARGGESHYYAGSDNMDEVAWHSGNSDKKIHPVGEKKPNGFGLYDMSGNVCEWVWDFRADGEYKSRVSGIQDPKGPTSGSSRGFRGGAYHEGSKNQQVSYRNGVGPAHGKDYVGFRIAILG